VTTDVTNARLGPFLAGAQTGPGWDAINEQLARPRNQRPTLDEVREELAVRDMVARYVYTFDQGDLEGVLQFFTDDCVISSPRGSVSGSVENRANYEHLIGDYRHRQHFLTNVVVRLFDGLREGVVTCYHQAVLQPEEGSAGMVGGVLVDRVVKVGGGWKIAARTSTIDLAYEVVPATIG
jgi:hypothetical protein